MNQTGRLSRSTRPRRYELLITPDLDASTFSGEVVIALEMSEPTDTIVLHAKGLDVALVELSQGGAPVAADLRIDAERDYIVITAKRPLLAGDAILELQFDGPISHGLFGFYRSTYLDEAGAERVLAATQFEAAHARCAFPCFDEPEFKAMFAITLVVADGLLALSNGPEIDREKLPDGNVRVRFGTTIPISTYLVAWVVGPLEMTEPVDTRGVAVRVAHVPGRGHLTRFALDVGAFAIAFFEDYYGIAYPGEKCDLVALPDFSFGAMENLGCVTFRETRLLLDPDAATLDETTGAALTIVHEIAHMWFGDLVTMKWWNGIWLNEAFATFMQHLGIDAYKPEWKTWDEFALARAAALDVDALENTRTVEYEVVTPADADGMFDLLTYQKGGSVLRMLERWLGADAFRAGVRHYLSRYQLSNTETTDLWDALEEATGRPVRRIMDTWIFQPGFPTVSVGEGRLEQRRFCYSGAGHDERWVLPVLARIHTGESVETRSLLTDEKAVPLDVPDGSLVVLNAGGEGFYRVAYPTAWRNRLLDAGVLQPLERFALVDDLWASVLAGDATATEFLECAPIRRRDRSGRVARGRRTPARRVATRRGRSARTHARRDRGDREARDEATRLGRSFRRRAHAPTARPARQRARIDHLRPRDDRAGARDLRAFRRCRRRRPGGGDLRGGEQRHRRRLRAVRGAGDGNDESARADAIPVLAGRIPERGIGVAGGGARALRRDPRPEWSVRHPAGAP